MKKLIAVMMLCGILCGCEEKEDNQIELPSGTVNVTSGLMAYYTFDNEDAFDVTEFEVNGSLVNSPSFITDTPNGLGKALFLKGNKEQYVNIPYNPLKGLSVGSISIWLKDVNPGALLSGIGDNALLGPSIGITEGLKVGHIKYWGTPFFNNYQKFNSFDASVLQDGNWHMLTVTYDGDVVMLFVDGVAVDNLNDDSYDKFDASKIQIGGNGNGRLSYYNSFKVDNVRLYNRTLSAKEIKKIYENEK